MIGTAISAGVGLLGGIFGGISKTKAERKRRNLIKQQMRDNENWYQRRYNEDSTQRADAQNSLRIMREAMNNHAKHATASAAVTGATDESLALQKASANQALGNTVANIAASGDARKDAIEAQYMDTRSQLRGAMADAYAQQGQNMASAIGGVVGAVPGLVNAFEGIFAKKPTVGAK